MSALSLAISVGECMANERTLTNIWDSTALLGHYSSQASPTKQCLLHLISDFFIKPGSNASLLQKDAECACSDCENPQNQQIVHSRNSPKREQGTKNGFSRQLCLCSRHRACSVQQGPHRPQRKPAGPLSATRTDRSDQPFNLFYPQANLGVSPMTGKSLTYIT